MIPRRFVCRSLCVLVGVRKTAEALGYPMMNRRFMRNCFRRLLLPLLVVAFVAGWTSSAYAETEPSSLNVSGCVNTRPSVDPIETSEGYSSVLYNNMNGLLTSEVNAIAQTGDGFF